MIEKAFTFCMSIFLIYWSIRDIRSSSNPKDNPDNSASGYIYYKWFGKPYASIFYFCFGVVKVIAGVLLLLLTVGLLEESK